MTSTEARLERALRQVAYLRWVVLILVVALILAALAPIVVIILQQETTEAATVQITCSDFRNSVTELEAIAALDRRLGIPIDFEIPELPKECV